MAAVRLADYRPAPYRLERTDLIVRIFADHTLVQARLSLEPNPLAAAQKAAPQSAAAVPALVLQGLDLELLKLRIDGLDPAAEAYHHEPDGLTLWAPPQRPFVLETVVRIHPSRNTTLEGLYASGGLLTTQCEAEGFRRITFHPDRPDLLSRFQVRIEADRDTYPVLLSNGNGVAFGDLEGAPGRHYALWDDPFPKPSYLFALVAGNLEEVSDTFTTASGRSVALRLHVEPGDASLTTHAMACLKRAMAWDERVYGLEYDLDEFNLVAVRHFNMGAMENKGLNIFNSKLVLADAATATDAELERIESIIAHEYFHNWTGNRITCRDWFQLSLKEGLTVFRDQCFTADLHSRAAKRIEDVAMLRNTQFREDSGPTAHAVQPAEYQAIDNFYTTTIYEKGAELIRMLHTLLGEETFFRGMALYVQRHDGTAATCEDFVRAMEEALVRAADGGLAPQPRFDVAQFRRWYLQAGTPQLTIEPHWEAAAGRLTLRLTQVTPATPGQPEKQPLVIPLVIGLVDQGGEPVPLRLQGESETEAAAAMLAPGWGQGSRLLVIDQAEQTLTIEGLEPTTHPPALSLLRGFSAPVKLSGERPIPELLHLLAHDSDPFARWDSGQALLRRAVLGRAAGVPDEALEDGLIDAFAHILGDGSLAQRSRTLLLALPGLAELEDISLTPDPPALFQALLDLRRRFGDALAEPLAASLRRCQPQWDLPWPEGDGDRDLTALIWSWQVAAGDPAAIASALKAVSGLSMTMARAGLAALQLHPLPERQQAMALFYERWQARPVILDTWFSLEASAPLVDGLERVRQLLQHPRYDGDAPNCVRAVLGGFIANTPVFHALDGSGYRFLAEQVIALDQRNPITASRLAKRFSSWTSYGPERSAAMRAALLQLADASLSTNTAEVVSQCLR
ncbi:MAG: aminopeptidase N [Cyanobacteriota bacterium]